MKFNFYNYKRFCKDFKIYPCRYKNLKLFREYCNGNLDIVFKIGSDY